MKKINIVEMLVRQRDLYIGEGKFRIFEEAEKKLTGKTVIIKYPNGKTVTTKVANIFAPGRADMGNLFSIRDEDGEIFEIYSSSEVYL
jgi:hypothetical protein